ncbi:hypothetical protein HNP33_004252, partial [Comamonas odontotermitis]|nr:hypothetical protein [Comamonas odontotermitis]
QFVVRYLRRPQFVSLIIRAYYRCGPDLCNKARTIDKSHAINRFHLSIFIKVMAIKF